MTPEDLKPVRDHIASRIIGQQRFVDSMLICLLSDGHLLVEGMPGLAKTTAIKALAESVEGDFHRIQFTPDLLPSDILGVSIYDEKDKQFHFHEGPIFSNILLADEINRASPRTQSALLEAMAENQVSVDGKVRLLEDLFFVVATQNPIESSGTYPLPEAQMDRFALQFNLGYVSSEEEVAILADQVKQHPLETIGPCVTRAEVLALKARAADIRISAELKRYIVDIITATRSAQGVALGASPRASLALMKTAKALAIMDGHEFVIPEHIREIAVPVVAHRLVLDAQARFAGRTTRDVVEEILQTIPVPA